MAMIFGRTPEGYSPTPELSDAQIDFPLGLVGIAIGGTIALLSLLTSGQAPKAYQQLDEAYGRLTVPVAGLPIGQGVAIVGARCGGMLEIRQPQQSLLVPASSVSLESLKVFRKLPTPASCDGK